MQHESLNSSWPHARKLFVRHGSGDALSSAEKGLKILGRSAEDPHNRRHHAALQGTGSAAVHFGHVDALEPPQQGSTHHCSQKAAA